MTPRRCGWVPPGNVLYEQYHDQEWGVPVHDDRKLFEFLVLEGAQAGLSWLTILKRRQGYRDAFANFDPKKVAAFTDHKVGDLLQDESIIRNRLKVRAVITNAKKFLVIQKEFGSFSAYQWRFVKSQAIQNTWADSTQVPTVSPEAETFSKDLKQRGFTFVGPTIIYAHMQAVGMVNDHTVDCFRYRGVRLLKKISE